MNLAEFLNYIQTHLVLVSYGVFLVATVGVFLVDTIRIGLMAWLFSGRKEFLYTDYTIRAMEKANWLGMVVDGRLDIHDKELDEGFFAVFFKTAMSILVTGCLVMLLQLLYANVPFYIGVTILTIVSGLFLAKAMIKQAYKLADHIKDPNAHK